MPHTHSLSNSSDSTPNKKAKIAAESTSDNMTVPVTTKIEQSPPLLVKKLSDKARLPTRGSAFAAGYDIYASKATSIPAQGKVLVDTDISIAVPEGTCKTTVGPLEQSPLPEGKTSERGFAMH
jgi:dUTP pyrophosphatase